MSGTVPAVSRKANHSLDKTNESVIRLLAGRPDRGPDAPGAAPAAGTCLTAGDRLDEARRNL